jgi:hypothetical protein
VKLLHDFFDASQGIKDSKRSETTRVQIVTINKEKEMLLGWPNYSWKEHSHQIRLLFIFIYFLFIYCERERERELIY